MISCDKSTITRWNELVWRTFRNRNVTVSSSILIFVISPNDASVNDASSSFNFLRLIPQCKWLDHSRHGRKYNLYDDADFEFWNNK